MKLLVLFLSVISGCSSLKTLNRPPLIDQLISIRPNYVGYLTNTNCLEYDGSTCIKYEIIKYDLRNETVRKKLNDFGFICEIGGQRFKVCFDKPGFCQFDGEVWKYLPADTDAGHSYLLDARTVCRKDSI